MNNQTQYSKTGDHLETPYNSPFFCLQGFGDHGSSDLATYLDESQPAVFSDGDQNLIFREKECINFKASFLNMSNSMTLNQACPFKSVLPSINQDGNKLNDFTFDQLGSSLSLSIVNGNQMNEPCSYRDNTPTLSPVSEQITAMTPGIDADKFLPISPPQSLLSSPNPQLIPDKEILSVSSTYQEDNVASLSPLLFSPAPSPSSFGFGDASSCKASVGNTYKPVPCNDAFSVQSRQLIPVNPQFLEPNQSSQSFSQLSSSKMIATQSSEIDCHQDQPVAIDNATSNQTSSFFQANLIPINHKPRSSPSKPRTEKRGRKKKVLTPAEQKAQNIHRKKINAQAAKRLRERRKQEKETIEEEIREWDEKFDRQWYLDIEHQNNLLNQDLITEIMES